MVNIECEDPIRRQIVDHRAVNSFRKSQDILMMRRMEGEFPIFFASTWSREIVSYELANTRSST
jgi:hypothetical protein